MDCEEIELLDEWEKRRIYLYYYISKLALKLDFNLIYKNKPDWQRGRRKPDKEYLGLAFYYLHKNIYIADYDAFVSKANIEIIDCGDNWKEYGYAQRIRTNYFGIYRWYEIYNKYCNSL